MIFEVFYNGNNVLYVFILAIYVIMLKKALEIKNKRLIKCSACLSLLFALFEVIGYSINNYLDLSGIIQDGKAFIESVFKLMLYFTIFYSVIILLFNYLENLENKTIGKRKTIVISDKFGSFVIVWVIIMLAWIPYFLKYFPGILTADSIHQVRQVLGLDVLTNHHPIFHTFIISWFINLGEILGNINLGVAAYSIFQMLILSSILSFTIYYMSKKNINIWIRRGTLAFYALYPVTAIYSFTMWKDILFAGIMLLFTICMIEIATHKEEFFKKKINMILLIINMIFVILFRNNGIYVIIITMFFIIPFAKRYYKRVIVVFFAIILLNSIYKGPIFSVLHIKQTSLGEALSIPLQQFARCIRDKGSTISNEEKNIIYKFLPVENLGQIYNPKISDAVKQHFNDPEFENNKVEFAKIWIKLFFRYPITYMESFLCNNYGYWYPEAKHWVVSRGIFETDLGIHQSQLTEGKLVEKVDSIIDKREIPIISMMFSIGFAFWIILTSLTYCIYRKKYNLILAFVPILALWLTVLASPVFGEYRYVYSMFTCLPILIVAVKVGDNHERKNTICNTSI